MKNSYILGIDIGTNAIKVFIGRLESDGSVSIIGNGIAPTKGFAKGRIIDPQSVANSIKEAIDCVIMATNISVKDAYVSIGGMALHSVNSHGSVATLHPESITLNDVNRVFRAATLVGIPEDHEALHVLPQKFFVDKQLQRGLPLQLKGSHLEVEAHIVAAPKECIHSLVTAVENVGIGVLRVVANSIVVAELLNPIDVGTVLLMDVGAGTTELVLYREGQIYFSASLPYGGNYITSDIMQGLTIGWNHAEDIKKYYAKLDKQLYHQEITLECNDYGTTDKLVSYDFLYDIVESRVEEIVHLIHDYFIKSIAEDNMERIILTGGCGAMPSFVNKVETTFQLPVEVLTPKAVASEYMYPENTVCQGILQYAAKNLQIPKAVTKCDTWRGLISKVKRVFNS